MVLRNVQRMFHPHHCVELAEVLSPRRERLERDLEGFDKTLDRVFPGDLAKVGQTLSGSARITVTSMRRFEEAAKGDQAFIELHRALRGYNQAIAPLYLLAPVLGPVSAFFLEPELAGSDEYIESLRHGVLQAAADQEPCGVIHNENDPEQRGGFSLFIPENLQPSLPVPLVVALHGGSGHGREFLWNWLPEARSRGVIVLSPTSQDRTWSIIEPPDIDKEPLLAAVDYVKEHFSIDTTRVLLTGMSDGATYTLLLGLQSDLPFTHLAPVCGVLHPVAVLNGSLANARGKPVYQVNGVQDWMFPLPTAHMARDHLTEAGADLTFRAIEDLAHVYPRDENPHILDWLGAPRLQG